MVIKEIGWMRKLGRALNLGLTDLMLTCFTIHLANNNCKTFVKK